MTEASEQPREPDPDVFGAGPRPWTEVESAGAPPGIATSAPEREFAARVPRPGPPPPPPPPAMRRVVFIDVENTSRTEHMARVIEHLTLARIGLETQLVAVGNWRVISQETARLLASRGAQLVHSAPSVGVRDWTDLRIAVSAGVWLAGARASDILEIVSDDRAFDAVGDVAAALGISFRRLSYRTLLATRAEPAAAAARAEGLSRRSPRRGREREAAPAPAPAPPTGHTAPHDELVDVVRELAGAAGLPVPLDTLARTLKERGYSRTPGSPRLVTRLRRIKEVAVGRNGLVTLVSPGEEPTPQAPVAPSARRRRSPRRSRRRRSGRSAGDPAGPARPAPAAR